MRARQGAPHILGETKTQHGAAYEKAPQLRCRIEPQLAETDAAHREIQPKPSGVDGAANAQMIEAIKSNSAKARIAGGTPGEYQYIFDTTNMMAGAVVQGRGKAEHAYNGFRARVRKLETLQMAGAAPPDPRGLVDVDICGYFKTYDGAQIVYECNPFAVVVHWGNEELRLEKWGYAGNGHMIVGDELFVDVFGVGTGSIVVYDCKATGSVSMRVAFKITGTEIGGMLFLEGIKEHWSGTFDNYKVSTHAERSNDGIKVDIFHVLGVSKLSCPISFLGIGGWKPYNPGSVTIYRGDSRGNNPSYYTNDEFKWVAAHEFGHVLGIGDAYPNNPGLPTIMNGPAFEYDVQPGDITKALNAWDTKKWQEFP